MEPAVVIIPGWLITSLGLVGWALLAYFWAVPYKKKIKEKAKSDELQEIWVTEGGICFHMKPDCRALKGPGGRKG